jgi:O-antigen/teichoic acid export membrane protein
MRQFVANFHFGVERLRARLSNSPGATALISTSAWAMLGDAVSRGLFLVAMIACARLMSQYDYGQLGLVRTTILTLVTFGSVGLGVTANRFVAEQRDAQPEFAGLLVGTSYILALTAGAIVALAVWVFAPIIASSLAGAPEISNYLRWCSIIVVLGSLLGAQIGIMQGLGAYRQLAAVGLVQGLAAIVMIPLGAIVDSVDGAILGMVAYHLIGVVLLNFMIRANLRKYGISPRLRPLRSVVPIFLKFSLPAAIGGLAIAPFKWLAEFLLARSNGFEDLALFSAASLMATMLVSLVSTLNAPMITFFGRRAASQEDRLAAINLYGTWYAFLLLATPLLLVPSLASLPYGTEYGTVRFQVVLVCLLAHAGMLLYYSGIVRMMIQHGNLWLVVATTLVEGALLIGAALVLSNKGATGLAIAFVISYAGRILITWPLLLNGNIISKEVLLDKFFLGSVAGFAALLALNVWRLS